ncbi:MAG: nodulation protein NfeD [Bryobacterales bacterium]|nr:nodulation protein NfeD [Bryobacteraceae bacterium]MDW8130352.1 nodulation protein NfeD [Bryobacterales bacterium]
MRKALLIAAVLCALRAPCAVRRVVAVDVDGVVHPITVEIVSHAMAQAQRENAELLLVRLNTPGGLFEATRQIVEKILASPIPVVTFVTPSGGRAASAGFFLLQAGDVAAMAAGTRAGAASPVLLGGEMDKVMREKVQSDAAAFMRSIVAKRGRNAALAEKAVLEARSFTDREALDNRLIDLLVRDEAELLTRLNGLEVTRFDGRKVRLSLEQPVVVTYERSLREEILAAIADPNIALALLVLGALGVYIEFSSPGLIAPGVIGGILVLLGLSALSVLPINWVGVALLVLALILFVLEAKLASHGILAAGGAVSMVLGALLLIESPLPEMRIRLPVAVGLALPFALITSFLVTLVVRARVQKVATGTAGMIDEVGVAYTSLTPAGKVFVHGELWNAVSNEPVEAGRPVKVVDVRGLTLHVVPAEQHKGD